MKGRWRRDAQAMKESSDERADDVSARSAQEISNETRELETSEVATAPDASQASDAPIAGERGIPSINRGRSLQSRVSNLLAIGLMSVLGFGLLGRYYHRLLARPAEARDSAAGAVRIRAQGDMPLPPLGPIDSAPRAQTSLAEELLGPAPEPPDEEASFGWPEGMGQPAPVGMTPAQPVDRRFSGPVFAQTASPAAVGGGGDGQAGAGTHIYVSPEPPAGGLSEMAGAPEFTRAGLTVADQGGGELSARLRPTATPAARAQVLPTRRLLLPKGAFIDCTLETAIDSTLPGMTTCVLATDSFSADGKVVLLERGTKLVGETSGQVPQGASRVFVVWTQARTPTGVVVPLDSPGTDELGRSGLAGHVNRHFWQRFGAAILISVIDGAVQAAVNSSQDGGGAVVVNPSSTQTIMTEVLESTINIPPTVIKNHGDRIQVLVARDLDFRSVYELRPAIGG
jgi:type IV secretion system protein VirB10